MRIALVSQEYPPETAHGGIGTQNHAKAYGLAAMGHDVFVISHSTDAARHETSADAVTVIRIPGVDAHLAVNTEPVRWLTYSVQVAAAVAELHRRVGLDLVEFADWGCEGYIHLLNRTERDSLPTTIHLHGPVVMFARAIGWPDPESAFFDVAREMERTCLRLADAVFSSSRCSAQWCANEYGMDIGRIPVLHTGIDTRMFRPLDVPKESRPTVIFVGKVERNKGVHLLVEAVCRLRREFPGLRLRLVGRGNRELAEELTRFAVSAGAGDIIEFLGYVPRESLPELLSGAHIFAAPSVYEGGPGFVYLEAMACGLPIIGCKGSGVDEVISNGETGLLVPPGDGEALLSALWRLLSEHALRDRMGQCAVEYVRCAADSRVCIRRIEAFYVEVVRRHRSKELTNA